MIAACYRENIFSEIELKEIASLCDNLNLNFAEIGRHTEKCRIDTNIRHSEICMIPKQQEYSLIYQKITRTVMSVNEKNYGFNISDCENFQYTVYDSDYSGHYTWHMDTILGKKLLDERKLSFTMLLNDDFEGGNFELLLSGEKHATKLPAQKGRILLFPSFFVHRVSPITKGVRKSIAGWFYGPPLI